LGLNFNDFYSLTPLEFHYALQAKEEMIIDEKKFIGLQTLYLIDIQLELKDRFKKLEKLMPFLFNKEVEKANTPTEEKWKEIGKLFH